MNIEQIKDAIDAKDAAIRMTRDIDAETPSRVLLAINSQRNHALKHDANELLSEHKRIVLESPWQPIESAPKDGTEILVAGPTPGHSRDGAYISVGMFDDGLWWSSWWEEREEENALFPPTHWQPLPPPPSPLSPQPISKAAKDQE